MKKWKKVYFILPFTIIFLFLFTGSGNKNSAIYFGSNHTILNQIAQTLSSDSNDYTITDHGYNILKGANYHIKFDSQYTIQVFIYPSALDAAIDLSLLSKDGSCYIHTEDNRMEEIYIGWYDTPHFYLYKNTILLYVGSSESVLSHISCYFGSPMIGS